MSREAPPRRSLRAATTKKPRTYDEAALDDLLSDHLGPASRRRRNRTLAERERETKTEVMIALSLGFPIDALLDEELRAGGPLPSPAAQNDYIVLRNHILARWRADVRSYLTKSRVRETVSAEYEGLMSRAYDFLLDQGYINFGISPAVRSRFPDEQTCGSVIVVGAGLAAAGQLLGFGFKVVVLEGRDRPGGRVYTQKTTGLDGSTWPSTSAAPSSRASTRTRWEFWPGSWGCRCTTSGGRTARSTDPTAPPSIQDWTSGWMPSSTSSWRRRLS